MAQIGHNRHPTPLLDQISNPSDLRKLEESQLRDLADELRAEMIEAVSVTGGHLGAGLGVVELTAALHYVFETPKDKLIWDVSHQCYPHKILTGRRDRIKTLRQAGGLSGFTSRAESEYDPFGAAHSSTSISAGLGFSVARDFRGEDNAVIAVIGDGAMSAGMAYEAMNNAGAMNSRLIVILNDNDMSIAPPVGAMSAYLSQLISSKPFLSVRSLGRELAKRFPRPIEMAAKRAEEYARGLLTGGTLFEELGFFYVGPIDGHNLDHLLPVLKNVRDSHYEGPVLIHCVTQKGKGYEPAEAAADKYHGVAKFDVVTGKQAKGTPKAPSYQNVFAAGLIAEAEHDDTIVAVTAAMPSGTGLNKFAERFPERMFDVGIAEQHAVTFCAGMACEGFKPFAAIYSTFLQRGYDQVVHDVAIQSLPVRFAIDRAGMVGADGVTHQGSYDLTYLGCLPNFVIMGRIVREGSKVAILSLGTRLADSLAAADDLAARGLSTTVADARFAKPLDLDLVRRLAREHEVLVTVEEGAIGGFAAQVMQFLAKEGIFDKGLKFRPLTLPDYFIDHDKPEAQIAEAGLDRAGILAAVLEALGRAEMESPARA